MRFRVTSVTDGPFGAAVASATVRLEDWLNAALADADFGLGLQQLTLVVVSVDDDASENERWAKRHDKLGSFREMINGATIRNLSFSLQIPPSYAERAGPNVLLEEISRLAILRLASRPKRLPKDFDFVRCASAVRAALGAYVVQAA